MLVVKLRDGMEAYRRNTGKRMTYAKLAEITGISLATIKAIGSVMEYHPTLANVERLCKALGVSPGVLLEIIDEPSEAAASQSETAQAQSSESANKKKAKSKPKPKKATKKRKTTKAPRKTKKR